MPARTGCTYGGYQGGVYTRLYITQGTREGISQGSLGCQEVSGGVPRGCQEGSQGTSDRLHEGSQGTSDRLHERSREVKTG